MLYVKVMTNTTIGDVGGGGEYTNDKTYWCKLLRTVEQNCPFFVVVVEEDMLTFHYQRLYPSSRQCLWKRTHCSWENASEVSMVFLWLTQWTALHCWFNFSICGRHSYVTTLWHIVCREEYCPSLCGSQVLLTAVWGRTKKWRRKRKKEFKTVVLAMFSQIVCSHSQK